MLSRSLCTLLVQDCNSAAEKRAVFKLWRLF